MKLLSELSSGPLNTTVSMASRLCVRLMFEKTVLIRATLSTYRQRTMRNCEKAKFDVEI